ncbi:MAG TPA: hypothetical protein VFD60_05995 [Nitrososphaeraceae archaeon]|jgi:hypothetical protein|nr:hypothetical protein [Nitrososphaeraceae archaeon]
MIDPLEMRHFDKSFIHATFNGLDKSKSKLDIGQITMDRDLE